MAAFTDQELQDIQGFGLAGFKKDLQVTLAVEFATPAAGRALMSWLATQASDAFAVGRFNQAFSDVRRRTGAETLTATWTAVMISAAGYNQLGISLTDLPPNASAAFQSGMAARAQEIGDTQPSDQPAGWIEPFRPGTGAVHLLVVVASDDECALEHQLLAVYEHTASTGCTVTFRERGATLPGPLAGHEHFGFKDGISQPAIIGDDAPLTGAPAAVQPGEFVLGYPDNQGDASTVGANWRNGSYVVFRRLTQAVAAFRQLEASGIPNATPPVSGDALGAKIVGRWKSGAALEEFPNGDPGPGNVNNLFAYQANDATGLACPVWAHIRKANPRDETAPGGQASDSEQHRMLRRGIPFGPPLPLAATADDGVARGLHFFAIVADLVQQFEFVQSNWINNPNFPVGTAPTQPDGQYGPPPTGTSPSGPDPLVGEHDSSATDTFVQASGQIPFPLGAELVTVTGGEYFFLPSITALSTIAGGPAVPPPPSATAA